MRFDRWERFLVARALHNGLIAIMDLNKPKTSHHITDCTPGGEEVPVHLCDTEEQFKTMTVELQKEKIEQNTAASSGAEEEECCKKEEELKVYSVCVCDFTGARKTVDLCSSEKEMKKMTVKQLREKISEVFPYYKGFTGEEKNVWLAFAGKTVKGDTTLLSDYGIQHMSVLHIVIRLSAGGGGPLPERQGMGEKTDKTRLSMEKLRDFRDTSDKSSCQIL